MIIMQFEESKHPRDGDGKFTDKGGGEAKRVFELADELGVPYDRNTNYQTLKAKVEEAQKNEVVELSDDNELARLIASSDENKNKVIKDYLIENFAGRTFELSDGLKATVSNTDASKLSTKADDKRIAQLSEFNNIVKGARFSRQEENVVHPKYSKFRYYTARLRYKNNESEIWLNIGLHKNLGNWHIYAITTKK